MPNIKKSLLKVINPETGKEDLKGTLLYFVKLLNSEKDKEEDGNIYFKLPGSMQKRVEDKTDLPVNCFATFLLLCQELAIVTQYGGKINITWRVCDTGLFDDLVNDARIDFAIAKIASHSSVIHDLRTLKKKVQENSHKSNSNDDDNDEIITEVAEMIADLETAHSIIAKQNDTILKLEEKIKTLSSRSIDQKLIDAIRKARNKK